MTVCVKVEGMPENPTIIEAFPSRGYVSTLAANQIIKQLKMKQIGCITCTNLEAIAVVHDGVPHHPIRIYEKDGLVVIFSELIIPFNLTHDFTKALGDWFDEAKPKAVMFLASVPGVKTDKPHEIMVLSTDEAQKKKIDKFNLKKMEEGVLTGLSSSLFLDCCDSNIPATSLMVETDYVPDILASATLLEMMGNMLDIKVSTKELTKAGKEIETKFKDKLSQIKKGQQDLSKMHDDTMFR